MDAVEAHQRMMAATGGQPYAPLLEEPVPQEPLAGQALEPGHGALIEPPPLIAGPGVEAANLVAANLGAALEGLQRLVDPINTFTVAVRELLEAVDDLVDQDGQEIWMRAGEVELDQWTERVTDAAAAVRRELGMT